MDKSSRSEHRDDLANGQDKIERLLAPAEVVTLLGVSLKTLYRWSYLRHCGVEAGPEVLKVGGVLRYRPEAIRDYLKSAAK